MNFSAFKRSVLFSCVLIGGLCKASGMAEFPCARYTLLDSKSFQYEGGVLAADGFRPLESSGSLSIADFPLNYSYEQLAAIDGKPVCSEAFWGAIQDLPRVNFQHSSTSYYLGQLPYVVLQYAAGAKGTPFHEGGELQRNGLVNTSARSFVSSGRPTILGFYLTSATRVLIRAAGPALASFGVREPASNPKVRVYARSDMLAENDDWQTQTVVDTYDASADEVARASVKVGATPFPLESKDAALVITLGAGAYTAMIDIASDGIAGEVLCEIYQVPQ